MLIRIFINTLNVGYSGWQGGKRELGGGGGVWEWGLGI